MELDFTVDQEELRTAARAVLERERPIDTVRHLAEDEPDAVGAVERLWSTLSDLHWPALAVPAAHGGLGLGPVELAVVLEAAGAALAPGPLWSTTALHGPLVSCSPGGAGPGALAAIAGGAAAAAAVPVASGWPDATRPPFTAEPLGGGRWRLLGEAEPVVDAGSAATIAVVAELGAASGELGILVVPADAFQRQPRRGLDASRPLWRVEAAGLVVGTDALVGDGPLPVATVQEALDTAVALLAVETLGTLQALVDRTVAYAKDRQQFGVPIGSFQAIKHKLADVVVALEKARAATYFAVACAAERDPRLAEAASVAKVQIGAAERRIVQEAIQTHGGIGYTWADDLHLLAKRATGNTALLGTDRDHRRRLAGLLSLTAPGGAR